MTRRSREPVGEVALGEASASATVGAQKRVIIGSVKGQNARLSPKNVVPAVRADMSSQCKRSVYRKVNGAFGFLSEEDDYPPFEYCISVQCSISPQQAAD